MSAPWPGAFFSRGDCSDLKIGDEVLRMIAGVLPQVLVVAAVRDDVFLATEIPGDLVGGVWFHRDTGLEVDLAGIGACESFITKKVGEE